MHIPRRLLLGGTATLALGAVAGLGVWTFYVRSDPPPPVSLADAVASANKSPTAPPAGGTSPLPSGKAPAGGQSATFTSLIGTWQLVSSNDSFVGYRVNEVLANVGANTAVGRTSKVTGTLAFDGKAITAVQVDADLTTLQSDDRQRDNQLRMQAIETRTFPKASFKLTEPVPLDRVPAEGEVIEATAHGQLTLHGVTRDVAIPLKGQLTNGRVAVVGSLTFQFIDYQIEKPRVFSVVSIEDQGVIEIQLVVARDA